MKVLDRNRYDSLKSEQVRLVSKKHVEGLNRKELEQLERLNRQLEECRCNEDVVEFDYYY